MQGRSWQRWVVGGGVLAMLVFGACGPKNDCQRLAELTCKTEGTSPQDCQAARRSAKEARTQAEFEACGRLLRSFQDAGKGN
ncbi:MAG TPA: hypothetical protein PLQ97_13620 [Myxococcota bacterium]|nr:hypothetical protein [Myxococcota bacterium]HQK52356.1 hypothetical protein [Myxococcota bacterium]